MSVSTLHRPRKTFHDGRFTPAGDIKPASMSRVDGTRRQQTAAPAVGYTIDTHATGRSRLRVEIDEYPGVRLILPLGDTTITIRVSPDEAAHLADGLAVAAEACAEARFEGGAA